MSDDVAAAAAGLGLAGDDRAASCGGQRCGLLLDDLCVDDLLLYSWVGGLRVSVGVWTKGIDGTESIRLLRSTAPHGEEGEVGQKSKTYVPT